MRIAFYAPLKSPEHPVPSGDRQMARLLVAALKRADHRVELASQLRSFLGDAEDAQTHRVIESMAAAERNRIAEDWRDDKPPDLWFCYHPYYKAPDRIGPALCRQFRVPMVTVEASISARRDVGLWTAQQALVREQVEASALNLCLTQRDMDGLEAAVPGVRLSRMRPFVDLHAGTGTQEPGHLVTVAMMRPGDKLDSYTALAAALGQLKTANWRLTVAGDGEAHEAVMAAFAGLPADRITWAGQLPAEGVHALLARGSVFVWPGLGEAFGLAYLEAQAFGLPVVAFANAGVPEVVEHGVSGVLVPSGDVAALAAAVDGVLADPEGRARMAAAARAKVARDHTLSVAAATIGAALKTVVK
jgi:glycosyltransferase involved in cell wall biosynthesis